MTIPSSNFWKIGVQVTKKKYKFNTNFQSRVSGPPLPKHHNSVESIGVPQKIIMHATYSMCISSC